MPGPEGGHAAEEGRVLSQRAELDLADTHIDKERESKKNRGERERRRALGHRDRYGMEMHRDGEQRQKQQRQTGN